MKRVSLAMVVLAVVGLGGCKSWLHRKVECLKHQTYEDAASIAPLHGSGDLPPPANKQSMKIPELSQGNRPKVQCLDAPPKYQDGAAQAKPKTSDQFHTPVKPAASDKP